MSDFTPTTEQVRAVYVIAGTRLTSEQRGEDFDRWLAALGGRVDYPFDSIVTRLETTRGSECALTVMSDAAQIFRAVDALHRPTKEDDGDLWCRKESLGWPCATHLALHPEDRENGCLHV